MDDSSIQKVWERPWSTEEMRAHCSNWNLAGDAGLLKHLQEFSQNLMQKTHTAEVALDSLLEDMRNTSVDVQNATNSLLMLSNNQFVENRVYDDCEDEKEEVEAKRDDGNITTSAGSGESTLIAKAAEAILLGMSVIDTKFDCVEVPASDSEGEEDAQTASRDGRKSFAVVLEPRNPYALQPFPHLIGSKEFMEDDRVGLGGQDEEDDEEEEEEEEDVHLSIGQDLVAQGLNDSGSSLTGDMGDEGVFDEDEVEDQRVQKTSVKQAWESSSSNGSDDLVVENNVIRKKLPKNIVSQNDEGPFGHDEVEGDIFGGKESSLGDEFPPLVNTSREPPVMPKKLHEEDFDEVATKPVKVSHKKREDESGKKKMNDVKNNATGPKTHTIPSDNLFGPPKDEWKDDEDGESIFASTDGIFSGGRGLFDDLDDPFTSIDRRDANRFQPPPRLPGAIEDKPPDFKGGNDDIVVPHERKGDIFGDDEQDVFANIVVKAKLLSQKQKPTEEEAPRKELVKSGSTQRKDLKGVGKEGGDSWLFDDEADLDDPLWNVDTTSKKEKKNERVGEPAVPKANAYVGPSQRDDEVEEDSEAAAQPKLPVGARSFYSGGIDPFALGKKLTKELEDKQKVKQGRDSDDDGSGKMDVSSDKAVCEKGGEPLGGISEKKRVKEVKHSPDSASLFVGLDEGDDLFAPVGTKASKAKDMTSSKKSDLFDGSIFAPHMAPPVLVEDKPRKSEKKTPFLDVDNSKNLFGDFASDDDDIFSSSNSLGAGSSASKPLPNRGKKAFIDSSDPLFDNGFGKDEELFPGSLEKNIFSEKEVEDDLFTGFTKKEEGNNVKNKKKEFSNSIKTEFQVPLRHDGNYDGPGDAENISHINKMNTSDNLFGSEVAIRPEKKDSSKKTEASRESKVKPASHKKNESDDIFGESENNLSKIPGSKSVTGVPSIDNLSGISQGEDGNVAESKSYIKSQKGSKLDDLFSDLKNDDNDFLSSKKHIPSKSVQPSPSLSEPSSTKKKTSSQDLFSEFDSDGDDQTFSTPKGGKKIKADPLYIDDPLSHEDDLFSSVKPPVVKKASAPSLLDDEPLVFSFDSDKKKTESSTNEYNGKGAIVVLGKSSIPVYENGDPHLLSGGSGLRKSPPKTLNLEKVIPSPKPPSKVVDLDDDFFGSNEDDKIVQAWMKGHPPPLRDSKVETAMDDDITPGYTPSNSYDDFGPSRNSDQESSYFANIPSASLLRSHGKERARIQSHRRPPSRKVRKAASVDTPPVTLDNEGKPDPPTSAIALPSRDSVEEDGGSQGTIEEWSTPEAALASPPHTLATVSAAPPPLSNPLSPSTDEEQDFFDVLPVGHYPPPVMMDTSSHLSPFSDALGAEEGLWDKDDGSLFEDAQPMDQGGAGALWASDKPPLDATSHKGGGSSGWTPTEESGNESRKGKSSAVGGGGGGGGGGGEEEEGQ